MKNNNGFIKRLICAAASFAIAAGAAEPVIFAEGPVERIYVSQGASGGDGSKASPYGTLEQALSTAASRAKGMNGGTVEVVVGKGVYRLDKTLELGKDINGTDTTELAIVGEEGALPRITTSKQIPSDKFTRVTDPEVLAKVPQEGKSNIYQVNMKELGVMKFGQPNLGSTYRSFDLFMGEELMTPAKWPNDDKTKKVDQTGRALAGDLIYEDPQTSRYTFTVDADKERLERWKNADDPRVFGNLTLGWTTSWYTLADVLPDKNAITIKGELLFGSITKGYPWFIENLIEELDAPGEYYLDRNTGILYLYPIGNIGNSVIEYSVDNSSDFGPESNQKIINIVTGKNLRLENLEISNSVGAGITLGNGEVKVINCRLLNLYSGFTSWSADNTVISGCEIAYTKTSGVIVQGGSRQTLTPANSYITNNYIHTNHMCSRLGGPVILNGCGVTFSHNIVCDEPHWAVQYGGNDNIIEYNEIYGVLNETADAGVFYCGRDFTLYGNTLRYNYIHDIRRYDGALGINVFYQDDQASGITVTHNIVQRATAAIANGGGRDNTITNNVIIDGFENSSWAPLCDARGYGSHGEEIRTNFWNSAHGINMKAVPYDSDIWVEKYPQVKATAEDPNRYEPVNTVFTNNIISNFMYEKAGDIAPQVRELGTIKDNYYIPERLSYEYDDRGIIVFTKPSEFERLGCEWLDTSEIGILGGGNYTVPSPEDRRLYEEYVVDLAGSENEKELVSYPSKEIEIVDILSDPLKLDGGKVTKAGSNVILEPGATVGYNANKYDNFVLRGKFRTSEEFTTFPLYFKAVNTTGNCWEGNFSYSLWLKSDYMELQRWNPGSTVFSAVPSTIKTDGTWNTMELVCNTLQSGAVDLYFNLNGKTVFDSTDNDVSKITDAGYFTFMAAGAPVEFGKYEKTLNETNELYTDKNKSYEGSTVSLAEPDEKTPQQPQEQPVKVYIDEKEFKMGTDAYIKHDRTYVPLRAIFEKLGARVNWLDDERAATAFFDENRMYIGEGQPYVILNGEKIPTDAPAEIKNDSIMTGVRFVAEMFGCKVDWIGSERKVSVLTPGYVPTGAKDTDKDNNTQPAAEETDIKMSEKYNDKGEVLLIHRNLPKVYYGMSEPIRSGEADGQDLNKLIDHTSVKEDYYLRSKLRNLNFKLSNQPERKLNIVFLGGSITQNSGYRDLICGWLKDQYGDRFNFVNAGWGGTGSGMGADRLHYDVGIHDPDLVFVEFSVNDSGQNELVIAKNMESIVRQIFEINDTAEIVFLYTMAERDIDTAAAGKWHEMARVHDFVAEHYGIPSVFIGRELAETVKAGKAIFSKLDQNDSNKALPFYSNDRVHPNETGSKKYFETIQRFLEDMFINNAEGLDASQYLQVPYLFKDSAGSRQFFSLDNYIEGQGFTKEAASKYINAQKGIENVYTSETPGDSVSFEFTGVQAGVFVLAGPDAGGIDVYVDEKYIYTLSGFHQIFTLGTPVNIAVKTPVLENGKHKVSFTISDKLPDKSMVSGLSDLMVNSKKSTFESGFVIGEMENK